MEEAVGKPGRFFLWAALSGQGPTSTPASLLYPRSRQLSPRVRVFVDWLIAEFAAVNRR